MTQKLHIRSHPRLFMLPALILLVVAGKATQAAEGAGSQPETLGPRVTIADLSTQAALNSMAELRENPPLYAQDDFDFAQPVDVYAVKKKSEFRAFLQSFLIPGWGQYYTRSSWWKPALFVGAEVAAWYGVSSFNSSGNDKEDEYEAFATKHWDSSHYLQGLKQVYYETNQNALETNLALDTFTVVFIDSEGNRREFTWSHNAYFHTDGSPVAESERFENIGKYNQFTFGWDDYPKVDEPGFPTGRTDTAAINVISDNRQAYVIMRDEANSEFKKASTMLVVVFGNHLISGIEAAIGARRYNHSRDQFGTIEPKMRLVLSPTTGKPMPYMTIGYRF